MTNKLIDPVEVERYKRDSEWLPMAIGITLVIAGCTVIFGVFEVISLMMIKL